MTCPAHEALVASVDHEASGEQAQQLAQHVAACAACAQRLGRLRSLVTQLEQVELARPAPGFTATLRARLNTQPAQRPRARVLAAVGAVAACAAVLGLLQVRDGFEARGGGASRHKQLGFEVYVHEPGQAAMRLTAGQYVNNAAGYSFVITNRSQQQQYVMLFALDARAEVHWFYPAFLDPKSDPRSLLVPATPQVRALSEGITPNRPAAGPVRFAALFSAAPLRVSDVETRVRAGGFDALARAYPQLQLLPAELQNGAAP